MLASYLIPPFDLPHNLLNVCSGRQYMQLTPAISGADSSIESPIEARGVAEREEVYA